MNNINYKKPINKLTNNFDKLNPRARATEEMTSAEEDLVTAFREALEEEEATRTQIEPTSSVGEVTNIIKPSVINEKTSIEFTNNKKSATIIISLNKPYNTNEEYTHKYLGFKLKEHMKFLIIENIEEDSIAMGIKNIKDITGFRIIKVNESPVNDINDFKEILKKEPMIIKLNVIKIIDIEKDSIFRSDKPYPITFLKLLLVRKKYNAEQNKHQRDLIKQEFIEILTRCQYKICAVNTSKVLSTTLKHGHYKNIFEDLMAVIPFNPNNNYNNYTQTLSDEKKVFSLHGHVYVFDPFYENSFTFDLVSNNNKCLILVPAISTDCYDKESNWFNLEKKDLNLNIDTNIDYSSCNVKGELFRFLEIYIKFSIKFIHL